MHESQDKPGVEERLDQVEAKLIESEHRLYAALRNFVHRNDWPKGDPRRRAAWMALVWVWFAPVTIAVGGGTATLAVLIWQGIEISRQSAYFGKQNALITEQNTYFRDQLQKMDTQIQEAKDATREAERTHLIEVLWGVKEVESLEKKKSPIASARMREEALIRFVEIENDRFAERPFGIAIVDLSGAALSKLNTPQLRLESALRISFQGADFADANLSEASLNGANLSGACLSGANLSTAMLYRADLGGANLGEADLSGAYLSGAILHMADLSRASLYRTNLRGANLGGACLSGANLCWADLRGAYLGGACLTGANLHRADLNTADLSGANLSEADLRGADLSMANLYMADLSGAVAGTQEPTWLDTDTWCTEPMEPNEEGASRWRVCRKTDATEEPFATATSQPTTGRIPTTQCVEEPLDYE